MGKHSRTLLRSDDANGTLGAVGQLSKSASFSGLPSHSQSSLALSGGSTGVTLGGGQDQKSYLTAVGNPDPLHPSVSADYTRPGTATFGVGAQSSVVSWGLYGSFRSIWFFGIC